VGTWQGFVRDGVGVVRLVMHWGRFESDVVWDGGAGFSVGYPASTVEDTIAPNRQPE
jgi:hypothetical protein